MEFLVTSFGERAQLSGPPENCNPGSGPEWDGPQECPQCGGTVDEDSVADAIYEEMDSQRNDGGDDREDDDEDR